MKTKFILLVAGASLLATVAHAQYSIDWYKISGGGGTSTGGTYTVSGTIGQHDAGGPMTGGNFALTGGFWALVAVQTPGAPLLHIANTGTNTVVLWWASPSTGFNLQQTSDLKAASWLAAPQTPVDNGTTKSVVVNPPVGNVFYRLKN